MNVWHSAQLQTPCRQPYRVGRPVSACWPIASAGVLIKSLFCPSAAWKHLCKHTLHFLPVSTLTPLPPQLWLGTHCFCVIQMIQARYLMSICPLPGHVWFQCPTQVHQEMAGTRALSSRRGTALCLNPVVSVFIDTFSGMFQNVFSFEIGWHYI